MIANEEREQNTNRDTSILNAPTASKKYKIMCKFFMMGNCIKNSKCEYLHSEGDQGFRPLANLTIECPMYKLGFCKNGPLCKFQHNKIKEGDLDTLPLLPQWYLENYFEKHMNVLLEEFALNNPGEVEAVHKKYYPLMLSQTMNAHNMMQHYDIYYEKKNQILTLLNLKVRYFYVEIKYYEDVRFSMENNILITTKRNNLKYDEAKKTCDNVVLIIFNRENKNFCGFAIYKGPLSEDELQSNKKVSRRLSHHLLYLNTEWLWRTKLHYTKLDILRNPLAGDDILIYSVDGQEVSVEIGLFVCRMMIKRLSRDEMRQYMEQRRLNNPNYDDNYSRGSEKSDIVHNQIYVTNISNLQVNIDRRRRRRSTSSSEGHKEKRRSSRRKDKSKYKGYESDETVIHSRESSSKEDEKLLGKKKEIEVYETKDSTEGNKKLKISENFFPKNKLFSNAMEKLASEYLEKGRSKK